MSGWVGGRRTCIRLLFVPGALDDQGLISYVYQLATAGGEEDLVLGGVDGWMYELLRWVSYSGGWVGGWVGGRRLSYQGQELGDGGRPHNGEGSHRRHVHQPTNYYIGLAASVSDGHTIRQQPKRELKSLG